VILYAEVKRGLWPVLGARVEVIVQKRSSNHSIRYRERFELLDTGSGGKFPLQPIGMSLNSSPDRTVAATED